MHFEATWHAQGLRWIASLLESTAEVLEQTAAAERLPANDSGDRVDEIRLRARLRGLY